MWVKCEIIQVVDSISYGLLCHYTVRDSGFSLVTLSDWAQLVIKTEKR